MIHDGFSISASGDPIGYFVEPDVTPNTVRICGEWRGDSTVTLMQHTGLNDKNGKEIYEGDIIRTFKFIDNIVGIVQWCDHRLAWVAHPPGGHENTSEMLFHCRGHIEVIGNIYENPELNPK